MNDIALIKLAEDRGFLRIFASVRKGGRIVGKSWVVGRGKDAV
jgi:hypothetical protein